MKLTRRNFQRCLTAGLVAAALGTSTPLFAQSAPDLIAAAQKEGKLSIYGVTDNEQTNHLIREFRTMYPTIQVEYSNMSTTELYNRFISETAAGNSADVTWSSAMDLQVKLVNDGYAQPHKSAETARLPEWANWKNEAFGTTYEPIGFVYNKRLVPAADVPQSHADFIKLLTTQADKYKGKVNTYDPEKSGVGFMLVSQDKQVNGAGYADLLKALGGVQVRVQASTGTMMERIASGENLIGYNLNAAYALTRAQKDPSIGIVLPKDYTLVISRVMFIAKNAKNPNAAKIWLDFVLSRKGQEIIANKADLYAIRPDVDGETTASGLKKQLGDALRPVPIGTGLLTYLDQAKRLDFLKQWNSAVKAK
ncbi:ABC transporter substrate-binding protein [Quatrionicoccus australiensis]|uniref:ABC transporter substrate-binding protein n=1 Tax=Quatrionicoccus australiensis TaxID=138118 RepID=UPI001CF9ED48|nr:ABC transporter substrate-binding protein [Quatrionicoccus australiensis]MCB4359548.1 ABC transporter substrate-binding protein [Quatrionicoccus australiensis]